MVSRFAWPRPGCVTGFANIADFGVIDGCPRTECHRAMTGSAIIAGRQVGGGFGRCDNSVVTISANSDDFIVIDKGQRAKSQNSMAVATIVGGI